MRRRLPWLVPLVALALATPALWRASPLARSPVAEDAARRALAAGNRLVRDGDLEAAVAAYTTGWGEEAAGGRAGDVAGVLAYNLGTTLHRLGRRPEALLWYRRAERLRPDDRWLADNLALARAELAAPRPPPPGPAALLATRSGALAAAAVVAAWAALALLALRGALERAAGGRRWAARAAGGSALALALASLLLWIAPAVAAVAGPRPAVVLASCGADDGEVGGGRAEPADPAAAETAGGPPPGSEVWVRPVAGGWAVAGRPGPPCPEAAIGAID